jgi:hypothetical protein
MRTRARTWDPLIKSSVLNVDGGEATPTRKSHKNNILFRIRWRW